jgi:hypothetical protein
MAVPKKAVKDWTKRYNRKLRLLEEPSLTATLQGVYFIYFAAKYIKYKIITLKGCCEGRLLKYAHQDAEPQNKKQ